MASAKQNQARIDRLNSLMGFKRKYNPKTRKTTGKEFYMGGEYGRSYLGFRSAKTNRKISDNLTTAELEEFLKGYRKGLTTKKSEFK
jgi:hypothetical protein